MSIRTKTVLPIGVALLLAVLMLTLWTVRSAERLSAEGVSGQERIIDANIVERFEKQMRTFEESIGFIGDSATRLAASMSAVPGVEEAYRVAHSGDINDEADAKSQEARVRLREIFGPLLRVHEEATGEVLQLHFHLSSIRSLARLWRTDHQVVRDGVKMDVTDDLSGFRETIRAVAQSGEPVQGIEVGRGGFVVRGLVPVRVDGRVLGSAEVLYPLSQALHHLETDAKTHFGVFMDTRLLSIARRLNDPEQYPVIGDYVLAQTSEAEVIASVFDADLLEAGRDGLEIGGGDGYAVAAFPVHGFDGSVVGVVGVWMDTSEQQAAVAAVRDSGRQQIRSATLASIGGGLAFVLIVGTITLVVLGRAVIRPVQTLSDRMADIASGSGDLSAQLDLSTRDEFGRVAESFNTLLGKIREIVATSLRVGDEVVETAAEVSRLAEGTVDQLSEQAGRTAQVAAAAQQLSSSTDSVAEHCGRARDLSAKTSERAAEGGQTVRSTAESMDEMAGFVKDSAGDIEDLGKRSEEIGAIVTVINDIADQTNLLALNAAIEAARAGEHGRGFAVVADEVRKLADRTAKATAEIAESIEVVRSTTDRAVDRMRSGLSRVEHGVEQARGAESGLSEVVASVRRVDEMISQIDQAAREQTDAANGIASNIADIDSISRSTSDSSRSVAERIGQLSARAQDLRGHLSKFKID